ncbi:MAG: four helix bundle protein, partial [Pedobacter sp.]
FTYKDQVHFCIMARGSVTELLNHFIDAYDQGYLCKQTLTEQKCLTQQVHKMLNGYIQYLRVQQKRSCTAKGK